MQKILTLLITLLLLASLTTGQTKIGGTAKIGGTTKAGSAGGGGGGGNDLTNAFVAFWKLGEAAGNNRLDSIGSSHASESAATVNSVTGKIGNAAAFSETNYLTVLDNAPLSVSSSLTIVAWINISAGNTQDFPGIASKWGAGDQRSYTLRWERIANRFVFAACPDGTSGAVVVATANTFGGPSVATWYFVVGFVDLTNDLIGISVSTTASDTTSTFDTTAYTPSAVFDGTAAFEIGHLGTADHTISGWIDAVGLWSRRLNAAELTCLWNSGAGQEPTFAACP